MDYGVGNYVLFQTKNINPVMLQKELLQAYEAFYSYRNILNSIRRRDRFETIFAKCIGRYILRGGRKEFKEHIEWLCQHGFTKDFDEFMIDESKSPGTTPVHIDLKEKTGEVGSLARWKENNLTPIR